LEQGCGNCYVGREERKLPVKVLQAAMGREGIIVVIDYYKAHSYIDPLMMKVMMIMMQVHIIYWLSCCPMKHPS
jgi:hypothetical protein